jgi:hypothetical protein
VSKRNAQVIALAGAAALAGFGYAYAHRSGARTARLRATRSSSLSLSRVTHEVRGQRAERVASSSAASWRDADRISSAPDALDVALDLDGVFDGDSSASVELTARPHEHVPAPRTPDDEDAPAPEDLGRAWLAQATESERSLGTADTLPDLERLPTASEELADPSEGDQDETTAEYVRRHRISSAG